MGGDVCVGFTVKLHNFVQDADLSPGRMRMAYTEMVMIIRKLYQDCRLVHGDLSEYNILFHEVRMTSGGCPVNISHFLTFACFVLYGMLQLQHVM